MTAGPVGIDTRLAEALEIISQTIRKLLGLSPNAPLFPDDLGNIQFDGTQTPFLTRLDALLIQIRSSRYHIALDGMSDLEWLGAHLYLNELQGSAGLQIDLLDPRQPHAKLAIRLSPLFIDIAWVQDRVSGTLENPDFSGFTPPPPPRVNIGTQLGLFFEYLFPNRMVAGIHAVARPSLDVTHWNGQISIETAEAIFLRIPLQSLLLSNQPGLAGLELELRFAHLRRDHTLIDMIRASTESVIVRATPDQFRDIFEGAIFLNWRF
jgi:hypothetical protein